MITAYFTDPENICSGSRPPSTYLGDQLLLQTANESSNTMAIPFKQEDLAGTKWVEGGCFPAMGEKTAVQNLYLRIVLFFVCFLSCEFYLSAVEKCLLFVSCNKEPSCKSKKRKIQICHSIHVLLVDIVFVKHRHFLFESRVY